ncbi:alpha-hydroxy acid oxidase [Saccharopolyspora rosea]|uniref:Alpha-hydroxy acid oxidase n=1 Tax=Saccharopolyspora rosea TaxID=524884 RepID=A0ABW3FK93_9PSEU|nr:alpha-hydroxy acid oxidase [Saccharopolyspora rosea]
MTATEHVRGPAAEVAAARAALPEPAFAFVAGGAGNGAAAERNRQAWGAVQMTPRLPADVGQRHMATTVLGMPAAAPIAIAPMGGLGAIHPDGVWALACAAADCGLPIVVSCMSTERIEGMATTGAQWALQLYPLVDKAVQTDLTHRAVEWGAQALVLTIDTPLRHGSDWENATGFTPPIPAIADTTIDPRMTWDDVERLIEDSPLPVWIKGVLSPLHAEQALRRGAAGMVVSNHGGRQLDAAPATAHVLPAVAARVTEMPMHAGIAVDSGITTGTDVLRALTLGADSVLVGRQVAFGLAHGEEGAARVLGRIISELDTAMACAGCATISDATKFVS